MKSLTLILSTIFSMGLFIILVGSLLNDRENVWLGIFMTGITGFLLTITFIYRFNEMIKIAKVDNTETKPCPDVVCPKVCPNCKDKLNDYYIDAMYPKYHCVNCKWTMDIQTGEIIYSGYPEFKNNN